MLISAGDLAAIERDVGPKSDEGVFTIERPGKRVPSGSGFKDGTVTTVDTVAGRIQFVGDLNPEEKLKLGVVRQDVKYICTLKVGSDCRAGDTLIYKAQAWAASRYYFVGNRVIPTEESGKVYLCISAGRSDDSEPEWPTSRAGTVTDGGATWRCEGEYLRLDVLESHSPSTFGDYLSKKVQANVQQTTSRP